MADAVFDPTAGPRWVLDGRVVTMTHEESVIDAGRVYIDGGVIADVRPANEAPPPGFDDAPLLKTGGTIYPGMIELHNHLSYNVLPQWAVPVRYENRDQWGRHRDYRKLISGPMNVLGRTEGLVQSVVRWAEAKCLVGGTTTSQGIALYSNSGITKYYRGLIRNVEETNDESLPEASTRIGDVEAASAPRFLARLRAQADKGRKLILHLAEGVDRVANDHFRALKIDTRRWAINEALVGIHATGLSGRNFRTMAVRGGSVVWSPLSNLLLYGDTTDVGRARRDGITVALGSDWSPSGSKNLLMEMKVARAWCDRRSIPLSDFELVQMVTTNPAAMVGWGPMLGSIEPDARADFVVLAGKRGDPYAKLIAARESSIVLVVVNGVRRYGQVRQMRDLSGVETHRIAGTTRVFNLRQEGIEQTMAGLSLAEAEARLRHALHTLPDFARSLEEGALAALASASGAPAPEVVVGAGAIIPGLDGTWFLDLDHTDGLGVTHRHQLTIDDVRTGVFAPSDAASVPLSEILGPIGLDELTAPDDAVMWDTLARQPNLEHPLKTALFAAYGLPRPAPVGEAAASVTELRAEQVDISGELTAAERLAIVRQAIVMLRDAYVHLNFKRARHAVDPVQQLRLLEHRLTHVEPMGSELEFHNEMTRIFSSVRDLHTSYALPDPFRAYRAVLPFLLEECFEDVDGRMEPHYLVTRVAAPAEHPNFRPGVEVLYWNGLPIGAAIERHGREQAGGNPAAAFARGLAAMTVRPLMVSLPPEEEWVTVGYRDGHGEIRQIRFEWTFERVNVPLFAGISPETETALGLDVRGHEVGQARKWLVARPVAEAEFDAASDVLTTRLAAGDPWLPTAMPGAFRAKPVAGGPHGYVRIHTFMTRDVGAFVDEFQRLIEALPEGGLIIDVRGNGGGVIHAAEELLQSLTNREISPGRAQFATTDLMLGLCRRHAPSTQFADLDFSDWVGSLEQAVTTGEIYTRSFPITPKERANNRPFVYPGPVVLVVDALCYSATDIFAAGFIDHGIGRVLSTSDNTGAGGANVWGHSTLRSLAAAGSGLEPLPRGAEMRVSVRRMTRVGDADGQILEDIGISGDPFTRHHLTRRDIEGSNEDLIAAAVRLLDAG